MTATLPGVSPRAALIGKIIVVVAYPFIRLWGHIYASDHPAAKGGVGWILVPLSHFYATEGTGGSLLCVVATWIMLILFLWLYGSMKISYIKWQLRRRGEARGLE